MAKKKKTAAPKRARPRKETPLYEGEFVTGLDPPNHNFPLEKMSEKDLKALGIPRRYRWPLTAALTSKLGKTTGLFVSPIHGDEHWQEWADHPPTWMDPHYFLYLAKSDQKIQRILRTAFKKNDLEAWKRLHKEFQRIFDQEYLPRIIEAFDGEASEVLAQWMLRHYAREQLDKQARAKRRK